MRPPSAAAPPSSKPPLSTLVEVRRSKIQGRGVFATAPLRNGRRIIEYLGERLSDEEANDRYDDENSSRHHTFLFGVNDDLVIDARRWGNEAKYINHSCAPNCEPRVIGTRVFIYAIAPIKPGDELFYDYFYTTDDSLSDADCRRIYPCRCGAPNCRGTLAALKKKKKKRRARR